MNSNDITDPVVFANHLIGVVAVRNQRIEELEQKVAELEKELILTKAEAASAWQTIEAVCTGEGLQDLKKVEPFAPLSENSSK